MFCIFGVLTLYFILFARISKTMIAKESESLWGKKTTYVILLSLAQLTQVARKSMAELKLGTYTLFIGIISLLLVMLLKIHNEGTYSERQIQ